MKCPYLTNTKQMTNEKPMGEEKQTTLFETQCFGDCIGDDCMAWNDGVCLLIKPHSD